MLALHTSNLAPGLTMQQANPPCVPPLITGVPPQLIPMATVPQSQLFISGGYTLLPPIAPLTNMNVEGSSFGGLTPLHPLGGLRRPITAIPYYPPTDMYRRGLVSAKEDTGMPGIRSHGNSTISAPPSHSAASPSPPPPTLSSSLPPTLLNRSPPGNARTLSGCSPINETGTPSSCKPRTGLPNSLNLVSPVRTRCTSPLPQNLSLATTPDHTPQTATPHFLSSSKSPVVPPHETNSSMSDLTSDPLGAPASTNDASFTCPDRPKSADAVVEETPVFPAATNPYPINALIDAPTTSLARGSRTSSLSSSLSSFRFGGSLNKLWASQLSLSNRVNMKSTGSLNTEAATMPSLGNQYFALGGSLPELSLTSLTRLLPNSTANDTSNASQPSLFTLVHHPAPLYVYSSQQHLTTPFINPNGSITFGSFLSPGSSLCNVVKNDSPSDKDKSVPSAPTANQSRGEDCTMSDVKKEDSACVLNRGRLETTSSNESNSTAADVKMTAYSPITAHMIQPATHATLNRAVPVMTIPTFGAALTRPPGPPLHGSSPPHPSVIPHISPYSPLVATATSSPSTAAHPSHIVATPSSLDLSSEATPPSHLSPSLPSTAMNHSPLSPIHPSSAIDNKKGVLRQIGASAPSDLYLGGPPLNGIHTHPKLEAAEPELLTPTSEDLLMRQGNAKREKDKPYKCDHPGCERSFSFPAHLRSHIQQIHISYRPCKCEFPSCGKRFYTPQHLNVHRRVHTGERPFVCPYTDCCKAFTTAGNLKNHIRTHTGERPYACKFEGCTKRFAEMSSLKKHELTHTGEKPYKCRVCGKAFSQAGSRNTHERKHSRTEGDELGSGGKVGRRYRIKRVPAASSYKSNQN